MAIFGRLVAWLRRLFGAPRAAPPPTGPGPLGDLLARTPPMEVAAASISDHVARVVLIEPLRGAPDDVLESRVLETAWRALRRHPAEGPILSLEIWAPPRSGRPPERVLRKQFKAALEVPPSVSPEGQVHPPPRVTATREHLVASGPPEPPDPSLRPLVEFLAVPERLEARLRMRGVDTRHPRLVPLLTGLLAEAGYEVNETATQGRVTDLDATAPGRRVFVRCYASEGHVLAPTIDRFAYSFMSSHATEGFFVTDGLLPFASRHWERDPRIHLLDRVGLQRLIEAVAAGAAAGAARTTA